MRHSRPVDRHSREYPECHVNKCAMTLGALLVLNFTRQHTSVWGAEATVSGNDFWIYHMDMFLGDLSLTLCTVVSLCRD